ncbi:MAG: hypothetical protein H6R18_1696 [Proteobacteria bacterium]|nr:hypothetical protein [Pseudomonadota bacterium]
MIPAAIIMLLPTMLLRRMLVSVRLRTWGLNCSWQAICQFAFANAHTAANKTSIIKRRVFGRGCLLVVTAQMYLHVEHNRNMVIGIGRR